MTKQIRQLFCTLLPLLLISSIAQAAITADITSLASSSHPVNTSDNAIKRQITMTWTAAQSGATLSGYYYIFNSSDASSTTLSDVLAGSQLGASAVTVTSAILDDSNYHYFHIVAFDSLGAFGAVKTKGPYVINTRPEVQTVVDSSGDSSGSNGTDQTLTISGSRFMDALSVTVASTSLTSVTRNSSSQITATLPSSFATGSHDVKVTNTAVGKSHTLSSAYTVTAANTAPTADGAVVGLTAPYSYTKSGATDTVTISLTAADSTDTDGDDLTYTWSVDEAPDDASDSSLSSTSSSTPTYQTDVAGTYLFGLIVNDGTVSSDKVTVTVTVNDPGNTPPTANAGADQSVTVNGSPLTLSGSQSSDSESSTLTYSWSITEKPAGSSATISNATSQTATLSGYDKAGSYRVKLTVTDDNASPLSDSDEMVVTATVGSVNASTTTLTLDTTDTTVGTTVTATVTPKDVNSNLLGIGQTVTLSSTLGTVSVAAHVGSGVYEATIDSTTSGVGTVSVSVNSTTIDATDAVTFNPGALSVSTSTVEALPAIASTDDTITVSVTPKDSYGNKLGSGQMVAITPSTETMNGAVTDTSGVYSQTYTMRSQDVTFTASVASTTLDATDSVRYVSDAASATYSTITADATDNLTADGSDTSTITVTVKSNSNSALSGQEVTLSSSDSSDTVSAAATTSGSGEAQFTVKSTVSGTKTLTAVVGANGDSVTLGTVDITFVAGTATTITVKSGDAQSAVVGNAVSNPLIATVTDANGNVVTGSQVDFSVISNDATGTLSDASDTTNSSGDASTTLTLSTTSGSVQVRAALNGTNASDTFTLTANPGAISLGSSGMSTIVVGETAASTDTTKTLQTDGTDTIWLILKDQYGNLVGNTDTLGNSLTVAFSGPSGGGSYSTSATYVSASKAYKTVLTAPSSGSATATITATVDAVGLGKSVSVNYTAGTLNIDGSVSTKADALTDGIIIIKHLLGFTGSTLVSNSVAGDAVYTTNEIETLLSALSANKTFDADGNGSEDALTDGILIIKYLLGFTGGTLTSGALAGDAVNDADAVKAYLDSINPNL